ncbi:hypothetical protein SprV_0100091600 [Sparganum proliferum]
MRKLSNVMEGLSKVSQLTKGSPVSPPVPSCHVNVPRSCSEDSTLDEAVKKLVELNRDKLSHEQLVDLLASFYYVTNRYFPQLTFQSIPKPFEQYTDLESCHQPVTYIPEASVSAEKNNDEVSLSQSVFSLREKKKIQWMKEQEEMSRLSEASSCPAPANYQAPSSGADVYWKPDDLDNQDQLPLGSPAVPTSIARTVPIPHIPPDNTQGGFFIGEDPKVMAAQRERQRQEWLAELDRQVQEKRALREREKIRVLSEEMKSQVPCTPVYLRHLDPSDAGGAQCDDRVPRLHVVDVPPPPPPLPPPQPAQSQPVPNGIHEPSPCTRDRTTPEVINPTHQQPHPRDFLNQNIPAEQIFSRGRGLADLEERSRQEAIKRRQQQLELQAAYDKQIKEREARRKEERERLMREELEEAKRIARERQRMEQEMKAEELRRRENPIATQEQKREKDEGFKRPPSRGKVQSPVVGAATPEKQMSVADSPIPKADRRAPVEEKQATVEEWPILTMDRPLPTTNKNIANSDKPIPTVDRRIVGVPQTERPPSRPLDACPSAYVPATNCTATNSTNKKRHDNSTTKRSVGSRQAVPRANGNATYNAHQRGATNYRRPSNRDVSGVVTPTDFGAAARAEYRQESSRRASDRGTPLGVIRTQANLCPPAADFLSAITNPDYAYDGVCSGLEKCQVGKNASHTRAALRPSEGLPQRSALEQVSKIKRNLLQRQEELRSMQIGASTNSRPL